MNERELSWIVSASLLYTACMNRMINELVSRCSAQRLHCYFGIGLFMVGIGIGLSGCTITRNWDGPQVELVDDGGGAIESGMYRDMPYIMASIDGREPMKFLFDTGANLNVLFTKTAKQLETKSIGKIGVNGASGLTKTLPIAFIDELTFGPIKMNDMAFLVHDLSERLSFMSTNTDIAGIIGIRGLEEFTIDIDYPNKQVAITQERLDLDDPSTSVMYRRPGGLLMVPVQFIDPEISEYHRVVWCLLDTGNTNKFDLHTDIAAVLIDQDKITSGHRTMGIHGIDQLVDIGPIRTDMRIGDVRFEGMNASVSDVESRLDSSTLRNFHLKIDMKSELVSFSRPDSAHRLVSASRMGITNLWLHDGYRIDQSIIDSPAHLLGIRAYDEVLLINGVEPELMHVKTPYWGVSPDANSVTLRIRRSSDDGWVDVVLPIDGSVEGIEQQSPINGESNGVQFKYTNEDGEIIRGRMTPMDPEGVE